MSVIWANGVPVAQVVSIDPNTGVPAPSGIGTKGVTITTGIAAVTGQFSSIQCVTDTTFTSLTETGVVGGNINGQIIKAGTMLYGQFTGYTLTSGIVRAHHA